MKSFLAGILFRFAEMVFRALFAFLEKIQNAAKIEKDKKDLEEAKKELSSEEKKKRLEGNKKIEEIINGKN